MSDDRTRIAPRGSAVNIGTELNQTYRIDALIGVGGMGEVFKGHNIQTGDPVAIKIVLPEFAQDETILGLFRKEARILNHLNHEAIVRYYVFSIDPYLSRPYLAMEFVDGPSLAAHVKTAPLTPPEFMPLLRRLADGLHRAHGAGVIHRDMSPDNVILPGGLVQNAKIIDFGIARSANVGGETLLGGSFAGKYNFVSPEQLGLYGGEVTPKSDIYSLALVMIAAMRGQPLNMSGSQVDVIEKRRSVPDLTGIPKQFQAVLSAMLLPDPAKRPADMAAIRDWPDVDAAAKPKSAKPKSARAPVAEAAPPQPSNALRNSVFAIAAVAVIGVGALGGWIYSQKAEISQGDQTKKTEPSAPTQTSDKPQDQTAPSGGENQAPKTDIPASVPSGDKSPDLTTQKPPADSNQTSASEPGTRNTTNAKPQDTAEPKPSGSDTQGSKGEGPAIGSTADKPPQTPDKPPQTPEQKPPADTTVATNGPTGQQLPPTTNSQPLPQPPTDSLETFVAIFGADKCFAATTTQLSGKSAAITALGTAETSRTFSDAFKQKSGFAPNVTLDPVSEQQCGFVGALQRMSVPGATPLTLTVNKSELHGGDADTGATGDTLTVSVTGGGERNIYLFLMDYKGGIQNINRLCASCITMKTGEIEARLSLFVPPKVEGESRPPFFPTLVFAVASPGPMISVNAQDAFEASDFIAPFLKEVSKAHDVATTVAFVKLRDP